MLLLPPQVRRFQSSNHREGFHRSANAHPPLLGCLVVAVDHKMNLASLREKVIQIPRDDKSGYHGVHFPRLGGGGDLQDLEAMTKAEGRFNFAL